MVQEQVETKQDRDERQFTVRLPAQLHRRARIKSVITGRPIADVVREALQRWVDEPVPEEPAVLVGHEMNGG